MSSSVLIVTIIIFAFVLSVIRKMTRANSYRHYDEIRNDARDQTTHIEYDSDFISGKYSEYLNNDNLLRINSEPIDFSTEMNANKEEEHKKISDDFDLGKAMLHSEILNAKYIK